MSDGDNDNDYCNYLERVSGVLYVGFFFKSFVHCFSFQERIMLANVGPRLLLNINVIFHFHLEVNGPSYL